MNRSWISIRLPLGDKSYLQDVEVYIFSLKDGFLMIDAGLNTDQSYSALLDGLKGVGYKISNLKGLIVSHYHWDHCGLAVKLQNMLSIPVYLHESDRRILQFFKEHVEHYPEKIWEFYHSYGVPEATLNNIVKELYVYKALILGPTDTLSLNDGDIFELEDGYLKAIHTPGHTPGHMAFFYPKERIFFGIDFLLKDEWPHGGIYPHTKEYNPIKDYLASLRRVRGLEPEMIIPSHGEPIYEPVKRINEAIAFIENKIEDVYKTLKSGPVSLSQVCDRAFKSYDSSLSYFFLLSVALGYVKYLKENGMVEEIRKDRITLFKGI